MIWVPGRLLLAAGRDGDLRQFLAEGVLRSGLFPGKMPADSAARQWAAIFMSSTPQVRDPVAAKEVSYKQGTP